MAAARILSANEKQKRRYRASESKAMIRKRKHNIHTRIRMSEGRQNRFERHDNSEMDDNVSVESKTIRSKRQQRLKKRKPRSKPLPKCARAPLPKHRELVRQQWTEASKELHIPPPNWSALTKVQREARMQELDRRTQKQIDMISRIAEHADNVKGAFIHVDERASAARKTVPRLAAPAALSAVREAVVRPKTVLKDMRKQGKTFAQFSKQANEAKPNDVEEVALKKVPRSDLPKLGGSNKLKDVRNWSTAEVADFLRHLNLSSFKDKAIDNSVNGRMLHAWQ